MHPKLKFQLNKKLDKDVCKVFLFLSVGGLNFAKEILKIHPELEIVRLIKNRKDRETEIDTYIDWFYKHHRTGLSKKRVKFRALWKKVEEDFFDKTAKVFKGHPWPKGKYVCYLSIFPCGPRFLINKTFQSFYKYSKETVIQQIVHEMLHFMFYDYLYRNYPKYKAKKYEQKIWEISEAFNYVIQNQKDWIKLFGKPILPYPKLKGLAREIKEFWHKRKDIDYLLKRISPN